MSYTRFASTARAAGSRTSGDPLSVAWLTGSLAERLQALGEPAGVRFLGLGERLEPLGDLLETLAAGGLRKARVHLGELVGLAVDRGLEVLLGRADRRAGAGIADLLQEIEVPEGVAGLGLGGVPEEAAHVRISLDIGAASEVEVAAVRLRLAGERVLQVLVRPGLLEPFRHQSSSEGTGVPPRQLSGTVTITDPDERSQREARRPACYSPRPRTLARARMRSIHAWTGASAGSSSTPRRPSTMIRGAND